MRDDGGCVNLFPLRDGGGCVKLFPLSYVASFLIMHFLPFLCSSPFSFLHLPPTARLPRCCSTCFLLLCLFLFCLSPSLSSGVE